MNNGENIHKFDEIFDTDANQTDVFEFVSPLVTSALDGYCVSIIAYGQTGKKSIYFDIELPNDEFEFYHCRKR